MSQHGSRKILTARQYAQRARAIQSKPQIQQIADDGDKQALIERLRAEVAFLREQIRNSERSDRRSNVPQERSERQNEREIELQSQLLDIQENYGALSQRHAKLISDITRSREAEDDESLSEEHMGDSAVERLKRSNSFAEAVEQVVLEYEKTIQSLESSLSSTRSSLATSESSLLEKETKFAYIETVNQQLQARVQKLMDRESSTENYLHDLEAKLDGHTSGEEKNAAIVIELRKEIARVRENEASCEDYISTLEERLAEADQDVELMQREIDRLEHVVERQRSLGKLDNLLYELDHIQQDEPADTEHEEAKVNGKSSSGAQHEAFEVETQPKGINGAIHEEDEEAEGEPAPEISPETPRAVLAVSKPTDKEYPPQSPAQSKFVADKLEDVTQELVDLRVEHENTVNEFDLLSAKYEEALRALGELQDTVDENRQIRHSSTTLGSTRPTSFLEDARVNELKDGEHISSSRSLSSELFSAGASPDITEVSENGSSVRQPESSHTSKSSARDAVIMAEVEHLKRLQMEKEENMQALAEQYAQLHEQHQETLDVVEELKTEVQKAKMNPPAASTPPVIRRKSSQNVMIIDRAHRSFASLRNIATDNFEDKPDVMQNFELNLNAAMHELHSRSERVQELEADIASVKKEMETKMTIISGLTRERSSMKNQSPMDMSVVASMRDQLVQSENQMRMLQEAHTRREKELSRQIETLNTSVASRGRDADHESDQSEHKIAELQQELAHWESRHQSAITSMQSSEKQLLSTIGELEAKMNDVESLRVQKSAEAEAQGASRGADLEQERADHDILVASLMQQINEHKATISAHAARVDELEKEHHSAREQLEETDKSRQSTESELSGHRLVVAKLEHQLSEHQAAIAEHEEGLKSLHESHAREVEGLQSATQGHRQNVLALEEKLAMVNEELSDLLKGASAALNEQIFVSTIQTQIQAVVEERDESRKRFHDLKDQLATTNAEMEKNTAALKELSAINDESMAEIERLNEQNKKSARLVDELEEQLSSNFDQHVAANKRLSTLEAQRNVQVEEAMSKKQMAESEVDELRSEISRLEVRFLMTGDNIANMQKGQDSRQPAQRNRRGQRRQTAIELCVLKSPQERISGFFAVSASRDPSSSATKRRCGCHQRYTCSASDAHRLSTSQSRSGGCSAGRRPRSSNPHNREASLCRETAHVDAGRSACRPRDARQED